MAGTVPQNRTAVVRQDPVAYRLNPIAYLDNVRASEPALRYKQRSLDWLEIQPGHRVLDVGCGTGEDVIEIGRRTGPSGHAVGLDISSAMIDEANRRVSSSMPSVRFYLGDVHALAFDDDCFDSCRSDRAVQHMEDPPKAIAEMARVVRPRGFIVVVEPDWETLCIDSADRKTTRAIVNYLCDHSVKHGWIGRRLPGIFRSCGLTGIEVAADAFILTDFATADRVWSLRQRAFDAQRAGRISALEAASWITELEHAARTSSFFSAAVGFMVRGRKAG